MSAAGWRAERLSAERAQFMVVAGLMLALQPAWIPVDYFLVPEAWRGWLPWRLADMAFCAWLLWWLPREQSLRRLRLLGGAKVITISLYISAMLPRVDEAYYVYILGCSLVFWGVGAAVSATPGRVGVVAGLVAVCYAAVHLAAPSLPRPALDYLGGTIYLFSIVVIAGVLPVLRYRLERRAYQSAAALVSSNAALERAIATLEDTQLRLVESEKLMALGRLLAGLSHEINNPLTVVHNNVEPLREYHEAFGEAIAAYRAAAEALPPEARSSLATLHEALEIDFALEDGAEALDAVAAATERIRSIHADLRAFIRGRSDVPGRANLDDCVAATVNMLRRGLPEGVDLRVRLGGLPDAPGHGSQLNQVLLNLLRNALDAVGDAGAVMMETACDDDAVEVTVTDSGPGVAPDIRDQIFEPFFTTKAVGHGTGLGLAVSYEIIDQHGGSLTLDDGYTGGARFRIRLPR